MARGNASARATRRAKKINTRRPWERPPDDEPKLRAAIVTSPRWAGRELSFAEDLRLAKAAVLYMDKVDLYSYAAVLREGFVHAAEHGRSVLFEYLDQLPPYARLELGLSAEFRDRRSEPSQVDLERIETLLTKHQTFTGSREAEDLDALAETGRLVFKAEGFDLADDGIASRESYRYLLEQRLDDPRTRPLFDNVMADAVKELLANSSLKVDERVARHAREGALGAGLIAQLPVFPDADVESLLKAREELTGPLRAYRQAVNEMASAIAAEGWDRDRFDIDLEDLRRDVVDPAKADLRKGLRDTRLMSRAVRGSRVIASGASKAVVAGTLTFFLGNLVPELAPYLTGVGPATVAGVLAAAATSLPADQTAETSRSGLRQNGLYYLVELEHRL